MAGQSVSLNGSVGPTPTPIGLNIPGVAKNFIKIGSLGQGLPGFTPQVLNNTDNSYYNYEQPRFEIVQAWNNQYKRQLYQAKRGQVITPFRAVNNSGDILSRPSYSCGGATQTPQSRPGLYGLKTSMGHNQNDCDGTGIPPATCNVKYVYDSSDYSRYLKQMAIQKNFNVLNNGGDQSSASQSAWRAIRRY
jgi:hypothetical protein